MRPGGGAPDSPGWTVRVVPNKYPALGPPSTPTEPDARPELFSAAPAVGAHEVIVNAPASVTSLADLPAAQVQTAVEVWRARMREHADAACTQLIVNERREGGASLPHTHAQLYALGFVPAEVARERERFGAYATRTMGQNLLADVVQEEVRRRERDRGDRRRGGAHRALRLAGPDAADARAAAAPRALRGRRRRAEPRSCTTACAASRASSGRARR